MGRKSRSKRLAFIEDVRVRPRVCPLCYAFHDAATSVSFDEPRSPHPKAGDLTVCSTCSGVLAFTPTGYRVATQDDVDTLDPDARRVLLEFSTYSRPRT